MKVLRRIRKHWYRNNMIEIEHKLSLWSKFGVSLFVNRKRTELGVPTTSLFPGFILHFFDIIRVFEVSTTEGDILFPSWDPNRSCFITSHESKYLIRALWFSHPAFLALFESIYSWFLPPSPSPSPQSSRPHFRGNENLLTPLRRGTRLILHLRFNGEALS